MLILCFVNDFQAEFIYCVTVLVPEVVFDQQFPVHRLIFPYHTGCRRQWTRHLPVYRYYQPPGKNGKSKS